MFDQILSMASIVTLVCLLTGAAGRLQGHIKVTEAELDAAVKVPASGGVDPTSELPNELLMMIVVLCIRSGACSRRMLGRVCCRWKEVAGTIPSSMSVYFV